MTVLRSPRLETLLGGAIPTAGSIEYRNLELLKSGQVGEAEDLDYKRDLYGNSDGKRRDLCTDVAALASTRGGLLILGIEEDDQGRAVTMTDVDLSDAEATRMHQIIGSGVHPLPTFEIIPVENPATPGKGCYAITIAPGPRQPYAVAVNDGYRYPRRVGMTIGYLTEPEIETSYRRRDAVRRNQTERSLEIENTAYQRLDNSDPWVMVSLVPDQLGEVRIDTTTFKETRSFYQNTHPLLVNHYATWTRVQLGQHRFLLDAASDRQQRPAQNMAAELYDDGAGVFALPAISLYTEAPQTADCARFSDEMLVLTLLAGIRFLAEHARDRAHVAGGTALRATITRGTANAWRLCNRRGFGSFNVMGIEAHYSDFRAVEVSASIDDVVGPGLVSAAALLADGLFQGFGMPEAPQINASGQIRKKYWMQHWEPTISAWARDNDIEVIDEELK